VAEKVSDPSARIGRPGASSSDFFSQRQSRSITPDAKTINIKNIEMEEDPMYRI
jgi:purine-nucleoside phosphorylase